MSLFKLLFSKLAGSMATPSLPTISNEIMSGIEATIKIGNTTVGYATGISIDEDYELQGIRTLGNYGDRGFKTMGYTCRFTIGTFLINGDPAAGTTRVPSPTRDTAQNAQYYDFDVYGPDPSDATKLKLIYTLYQCKCSTRNVRIENGQLCTRETAWMARQLIPASGD